MAYPLITDCPVCSKKLKVKKLHCTHCHTTIENEFEMSKFASLATEQLDFIEVFIKCRGNIKEVEKELSISYPTVRGKLTEIIEALGYKTQSKNKLGKQKVLTMLDSGEITVDEAIKMLKEDGEDS
jgi:hypothetical protein